MIKTRIYPRGLTALSFPKIPNNLPYTMICETEQESTISTDLKTYFLIESAAPFLATDTGTCVFDARENYQCYFGISPGSAWQETTLDIESGNPYYTGLPSDTTFLWSNSDVYLWDNGPDMSSIVHEGSESEDIEGADEPLGVIMPRGVYQLYTGDDPFTVVCLCIAPDGGQLSYELRLVNPYDSTGALVFEDGGLLRTDNSFTMQTTMTGTIFLRYLITNTLNGTQTTVHSDVFAIQILEGLPINKKIMMLGWMVARKNRQFVWTTGTDGLPEKKLVGYLYGGVGPLPEIPKVDGFEFATLIGETGVLTLSTMKVIAAPFDNAAHLYAAESGTAKVYFLNEDESAWELFLETNVALAEQLSTSARNVWSNFDILTADGSTYLAASEPVPVYEQEE